MGTERQKGKNLGPPNPAKVGAVKDLHPKHLISTAAMVSSRMNAVARTLSKGKRSTAASTTEAEDGGTLAGDVAAPPVEEPILLNKVNGCYDPVLCQCCFSRIPTSRRCRVKVPSSKIQDPELGNICGVAFCIECQLRWGSEDRAKCQMHRNGQANRAED